MHMIPRVYDRLPISMDFPALPTAAVIAALSRARVVKDLRPLMFTRDYFWQPARTRT